MATKKSAKKTDNGRASRAKRGKVSAVKEPMNKSTLMSELSENTGLRKKEVASVFEELNVLIERHLKKRGPKQFTLPGLMKIEVKRKPAKKARKGINPFTGEETIFKAKPAHNVVKVRPLKKLKEMASS